MTEQAKDQLAERQARAAIALLRMGKAEAVWPLLPHSPDPRLRSFLINWLRPWEPAPGAWPPRLWDGCQSVPLGPGRTLPAPTPRMDAIFFQPETSIRRALILALGTSGPRISHPPSAVHSQKSCSTSTRTTLTGVHGAAEWTLRQWHEQSRLQAAAASLPDFNHRGERRWFVSKARQTFVLIQGPVEFAMGSPPFEPDRYPANQLPPPRNPPLLRHRRQGGDRRGVQQFKRETRRSITRTTTNTAPTQRPDERGFLFSCGRLLQLAQPQGEPDRML